MIQHAYCLTLRQTPERFVAAAAHFRRCNLNVKFFNGVHGLTWGIGTEKWFEERTDAGNWAVPPGHVGLNLSHWMLWSHLWHSGVDEAVVFEDDAILCQNFLKEYEKTYKALPIGWQFWFLGTVRPEANGGRAVNDRLMVPSRPVFGTHAYCVRRSALPSLLESMQSCQDHVDILLAKALESLDWYVAKPNLADQRTANGSWQGCCHQPYIAPVRDKRTDAIAISQELQGWCPPEKSAVIYDSIVALTQKFAMPLRCVELGVWGGMSLIPAAIALKDCRQTNSLGRGHITGIDPYTVDAAIDGLSTEGDEGRHRTAWANGTYGEYKHARDSCLESIRFNELGSVCSLLASMPDAVSAGFDGLHYLHIDDSHSVSTSCRNVRTWMPKIVKGGLLVLDDASWNSVRPARELIRATMRCREDLCDHTEGRRWEVYEK